ncbi:MAG: hypothetical protein B6I38_08535 [Anaerolineaceae bacterium 4572_5.1]|nr:MAG: hypothetical protein B6I38_08535 [Anaerolineaceae bacterium 4572_5.1]
MMRAESMFAPLDKANIPNFDNIAPAFINPSYDPGNRYCIPYQWGTTGIGYNIQATGREIHGWSDVFDSDFAGKVVMLEEPRETFAAILLYLGYSLMPHTKNSLNCS